MKNAFLNEPWKEDWDENICFERLSFLVIFLPRLVLLWLMRIMKFVVQQYDILSHLLIRWNMIYKNFLLILDCLKII